MSLRSGIFCVTCFPIKVYFNTDSVEKSGGFVFYPCCRKDTWLLSLQHKETIAITAPLPDCPSSRGKSPNSASFSSCSHKVILTLL